MYVGVLYKKEIDFVARKENEIAYYQVALRITEEETYNREFGNLKKIKDNYPKYIVTMDSLASMMIEDGIKVIQAIDFLR